MTGSSPGGPPLVRLDTLPIGALFYWEHLHAGLWKVLSEPIPDPAGSEDNELNQSTSIAVQPIDGGPLHHFWASEMVERR